MAGERGTWHSKIGFILAASGSAIGLGNIVFFSANAYKFGAGAFYIPYFIALFVVGFPLMVLELGIGRLSGRALPETLRVFRGRPGEFIGWFGILNASIITMYYITILGWAVGMLVGSFSELWSSAAVPAFGIPEGALTGAMSYFFNMISHHQTIVYVAFVWALNLVVVFWGTRSIEATVKVFVPLMWIFMIVLIIRGVTLPNGTQGIYLLFTPDFSVMANVEVWRGAFSQMFFTLSLGFGIMTAYASYLPKNSDDTANAASICFMNCAFEFIAGLAIFSLLFAFAIAPKASTLSMMFFVVPQGIANFPFGVAAFGVLFFTLLLVAGLTSSVSLVEAVVSSILDKYRNADRRVVAASVCALGMLGSIAFAWPTVIDEGLDSNGTLGLTLLDLFDHWVFGYGLMICGLAECVIVGWLHDIDGVIAHINKTARIKVGPIFKAFIRYVTPAVVIFILVSNIAKELKDGIYGHDFKVGTATFLPALAVILWLGSTLAGAAILSRRRAGQEVRS
ncbi:sodium-dependent transporter [bacterium]|nr:sodium-dependent transporter [bacterium]